VTRGNGREPRKSAAQIEDEIRRTRAELALTLDDLAYRLTPHHLLGKGIDMITDSIGKNGVVGINVAEAVRANRLPLALIGAGLSTVWLAFPSTQSAAVVWALTGVPLIVCAAWRWRQSLQQSRLAIQNAQLEHPE